MSSASQGPGWWQASDGNWYPPEQRAGYEAPPPPAPAAPAPTPASPGAPSWSAPAGQGFGNAQAALAGVVGKIPLAGWLVVGGLFAALIGLFLPIASASGDGVRLADAYMPSWAQFIGLLFVAANLALAWATYNRPQTQQATLIALSALLGLMILHLIINWFTYSSDATSAGGDSGVDVSPGFGLLLYTLGLGVAAGGVVRMWMARSKAQPPPPPSY